MIRKVKTLLMLAEEYEDARFSKEGILILNGEITIESEELKYIGNLVESDKVNLHEDLYME